MKKIENIHTYVWIELAIWFLILCFLVVGVRVYRYHHNKELNTYQIFMPDVDGVIVGSPVKFMGVQVGYIDKIKIVTNDVYVKLVITDKEVNIPKGSIATVQFNGLGGSKSLEIFPPTKETLKSDKLIVVETPKRLHDSLGLLNDMFDKIGSITNKLSFFMNETSVLIPVEEGDVIDVKKMSDNVNILEKWVDTMYTKRADKIKKYQDKKLDKKLDKDIQIEGVKNE